MRQGTIAALVADLLAKVMALALAPRSSEWRLVLPRPSVWGARRVSSPQVFWLASLPRAGTLV
jgi:hypothetical protein